MTRRAVIAFAVLLVVACLVALPPQSADVCLSADGKVDLCYCETLTHGLVRQPVAALSGLTFSVAGIAIMRTPGTRLHLLWGLTCTLIGAASIVFHATFLRGPGLFDTLAMTFWLSLFTSFHAGRALRWTSRRVLERFLLMTAAFFGTSTLSLYLAPGFNGPHYITEVAGALAVFSPLLVYWKRGFPGWRSERWLAAALGCFLIAFVTCIRSETGEPWCAPDALLQGHAVWHGLSALSVWLAFGHAVRVTA